MDYSQRLALSYYKNIATLNKEHNIFLVQHQETNKIYVKKTLNVYNIDVYKELSMHPVCGIPRIINYYEQENQLHIIEDYVSGTSLEELADNSTLTLPDIINYCIELCCILDKLHNLNPPIIHRDIKPSNIIITEYNHVILLDFNAAKFYSTSTTTDTVLLGTKGYAAPEQYGFGASTPKTDIYAVGILLSELTSSLTNIPNDLTKIIEICTKINPSDRYDSISDLSDALSQIIQLNKTNTAPFSYSKLVPPGFRTHTLWKMLIAIPCYLLIFWISLSINVKDTYGLELWIQRIFCLFIFLAVVFVPCNYLDIHNYFPLCKNKNLVIRLFGIILFSILTVTIILLLMAILVSFFSI